MSEIEVGKIYSNGKGGLREVVDLCNGNARFRGMMDCRCLKYYDVVRESYNVMTIRRFANWAKKNTGYSTGRRK